MPKARTAKQRAASARNLVKARRKPRTKRQQGDSITIRAVAGRMSEKQLAGTIRTVNRNRNAAKSNPIPRSGASHFASGRWPKPR